ncbi:uncharacterized protein LOC113302665 [Papaver somniferum]|uniref:uncharacterized protein LOC113302665 n=1 Tax=Papaver somniferum TaxID=3469 RepID=UPI000E705BEA|nr:uncharacterized protein LOC113302665 [Papaver somniferum]
MLNMWEEASVLFQLQLIWVPCHQIFSTNCIAAKVISSQLMHSLGAADAFVGFCGSPPKIILILIRSCFEQWGCYCFLQNILGNWYEVNWHDSVTPQGLLMGASTLANTVSTASYHVVVLIKSTHWTYDRGMLFASQEKKSANLLPLNASTVYAHRFYQVHFHAAVHPLSQRWPGDGNLVEFVAEVELILTIMLQYLVMILYIVC